MDIGFFTLMGRCLLHLLFYHGLQSIKIDYLYAPNTICRHRILYPLWLGPPFPNDARILKPKVGLGLNQIEIDLRKVFLEKYNFL